MIRPFEESETDELIELWLASTIPGQAFLSEDHWRSLEPLLREKLLPVADTWVVEQDGRMVAFVSLLDELIGGLFTHPDHQGRGHGGALIRHARGLHDPLRIEVFLKNERAIAVYERCGFVEERRYIDDMTGLETMIMRVDGLSSEP